jgi:hypothetical protein
VTPDESELATRLRLLETNVAEHGWRLVTVERGIEKLVVKVDENTEWRRDLLRADRARQAGLTRREKWLGLLFVTLAPLLTVAMQHFLR